MKNAAKTLGLGLEEESSFDWRIMLQFGELYFDFSGFIKIVHGIVLCCVLRSKHDFNEVAPGVIKIYQLTLITKSSSPDSDTPRNIVNQPCLSCACSRLSPGLILYSAMLLHTGLTSSSLPTVFHDVLLLIASAVNISILAPPEGCRSSGSRAF